VPWLWLVDPEERVLEVYQLEGNRWSALEVFEEEDNKIRARSARTACSNAELKHASFRESDRASTDADIVAMLLATSRRTGSWRAREPAVPPP
jgi:hypothetical protein